ncbi:toll/interleukin-1 receptor domain-containing protein [Actinoplanes sp. NPDC026670]|uniref:toll/interleukin-1 receptor domain-containing protein n=1 Tax=Actinoplanes sp. NPDC026670 TaxID=3154700 RepID=UPI0033DF35C1
MPVLVSHSPADEPWAHWISVSLRAAGHEVRLDPADSAFASRLAEGRFSSTGPVLVLLSAEHRGTPGDWALLAAASTLVGRLIALRLDGDEAPRALRAIPCRSLHGLDEEDALELVLAVAGGIRREKLRTRGLPTGSRW